MPRRVEATEKSRWLIEAFLSYMIIQPSLPLLKEILGHVAFRSCHNRIDLPIVTWLCAYEAVSAEAVHWGKNAPSRLLRRLRGRAHAM